MCLLIMLSMHIVIGVNDVMFKNGLYTQVLTTISLSLIKISSSNFQEMLMKASSFRLSKYFKFDLYALKVPFIRSWPICICSCRPLTSKLSGKGVSYFQLGLK